MDDADALRGDLVEFHEVIRRLLRQGHHDLAAVGVLAGHQPAKDAAARRQPLQAELQRPQPAREQKGLPRADGCPGTAVRLEEVAVPAGAHVVNHVQRQAHQPRLGRRGELQRRMDGMELVGDNRQRPRLAGELPRDDVDFVSALGQFLGEARGPLLQAAAERIEAFDDQPDSHSCTPSRRRIRFTRAATARISRLSPRRSFGVPR